MDGLVSELKLIVTSLTLTISKMETDLEDYNVIRTKLINQIRDMEKRNDDKRESTKE